MGLGRHGLKTNKKENMEKREKLASWLEMTGYGALGGAVLAAAGGFWMTNLGGNQGCPPWIEALMGLPGYEGCGAFGAIVSLLLGILLGVGLTAWLSRTPRPGRMALVLLTVLLVVPTALGGYLSANGANDAGIPVLLAMGFGLLVVGGVGAAAFAGLVVLLRRG